MPAIQLRRPAEINSAQALRRRTCPIFAWPSPSCTGQMRGHCDEAPDMKHTWT
jgi:hypothetical protein